MLKRVVIDTNIFIGACLGTGASHATVAACLEGRCQPLMGSALFVEYEDFLEREDLFAKSRLSIKERETLFDIYVGICDWTRVYFGWRPNLPDEGDNHLVELAIAGGAQFIVTRNLRDFSRMELKFPGLRIIGPDVFLKEILQ